MAEDISQHVWLTVIREIHRIKNPRVFTSWLFRIVRNACYRELGKNKHIRLTGDGPEITEDLLDEKPLFDDFELLHECLDYLCPEHKEALMLRFLKQMTYEEVAETTGISIGTVRSRLYYAKKALKKEMEKKLGTE
jgi:RNA polymerase sigma-70 factor (ECF subfamily)